MICPLDRPVLRETGLHREKPDLVQCPTFLVLALTRGAKGRAGALFGSRLSVITVPGPMRPGHSFPSYTDGFHRRVAVVS
jgi:hypothetical protein